jgi:hypothetical protein
MTGHRRRALAITVLVALAAALPSTTVADMSALRPMWPSIVVDPKDHAHVVYDNVDGRGLYYATNASGSWVRRIITKGHDALPKAAVDRAGKVHVIFTRTYDDSPRRIFYSTNKSGAWVTTGLPWTAPGSTFRIAVDPELRLHVVYYTDSAAYYMTNDDGTWVRERLDIGSGQWPMIAVDTAGAVHIAFKQCLSPEEWECPGEGIYYRTNASGEWTQEHLTEFQGDRPTGIVTDPAGKAHIVFQRPYLEQGREELGIGMFYLTNASGTWRRSRVASTGVNGRIALDRAGAAHIVYNRESETDLGIYYATNETGSWVRSTAIKERAMYQELAIDARGLPRIAFMRLAIDPGVYYAKYGPEKWWRVELMD